MQPVLTTQQSTITYDALPKQYENLNNHAFAIFMAITLLFIMARGKKSYKWINKTIESLDPQKDYAEIFRLSMSYGGNDFMNTLIYSLVFPNFIVTEWGARAVWREDGGKVLKKAGNRSRECGLVVLWPTRPSNQRIC